MLLICWRNHCRLDLGLFFSYKWMDYMLISGLVVLLFFFMGDEPNLSFFQDLIFFSFSFFKIV